MTLKLKPSVIVVPKVGTKGETGVTGPQGVGVDHVVRTSGDGSAGTTDVYTMWGDVGETIDLGDFSVYNGSDGDAGAGTVESVNGEVGVVVLTTGDIVEDTDHNYVTDAQQVIIGNTSGTNTGDQDLSSYDSHIADLANPHVVTTAQLGLGNVDNTSDLNKPISTDTQTALDLKEDTANKSIAGGYASLDGSGTVPASELPSYVDDVLEYANLASFPATGETGKIYIAIDTSLTYRWSGTVYVELTDTTAIWGNISGTLANQTDLQNALDLKIEADSVDTLTNKTITDLSNEVNSKRIIQKIKALGTIGTLKAVSFTDYNVGEKAYEVELSDSSVSPANAITTGSLATGEFGGAITSGLLEDVDTSLWAVKTILFVNGSGDLTSTEPTTGYAQPIAQVVRQHATTGAVHVLAYYPKQSADDVRVDDTSDYFNSTNVEGVLSELGILKQPTGYDRLRPDTMPDLAYDQGTRTVSVSVKAGQSEFIFWTAWKKHTHTTTQTVVIPDVTAFYYIYFDGDGVLQYVEWSGTPDAAFYEFAITAGVRYNATQGVGGIAEERHGIEKSSTDHKMEHDTDGARYANGMDIEGLSEGSNVYTQTNYGEFWDEDIEHHVAVASTNGWMYRLGATGEWTTRLPDNEVGVKDGADTYYSWNEWTGATWQLTEGTPTKDYWITFCVAQPSYSGPKIIKIMGQGAYSSALGARNAIETELERMQLDGLPGPEIPFLYSFIVKRDGTIVADSDGNLIYDFRRVKGGAGAGSVAATTAQDIATVVTNFDGKLSSTDTNVQLALDTIDDHVHTAIEITDFDTEVANNSAVVLNTAKTTNATHTGEVTGGGVLSVDKTAITNKTLVTASSDDNVLIADTSDTGNLKKILVSDLLGSGTDADAIHDNVAGEILVITEKATPTSADLIIIEDSADSNNKKRVQVGNLPGGGASSLDDLTDAINDGSSVFIGDGTGINDNGSNRNVGIGTSIMGSVVGGADNIGIAYQALDSNISGNKNIAIGRASLIASTGSNNIAIGYLSLTNISTGETNTAIGYNTGLGITTGSYNTILGSNISGLATTLSNNVILADGQGNIRQQIDNLGVTTFNAEVKLDATTSMGTADESLATKKYVDDNGGGTVDVVSNVAENTILGRVTAGSGDSEELTATQVRTLINVADGSTANSSDATLLARANHTGTQTASTISDFDTEVSNNTDVLANTTARHDAVTVTDSAEIDLALTGQDLTASIVASSIDETKLDTSVNASLDLADSALQDLTGTSIKELSDVLSTMTPTDGQVLTYDITNGWQSETIASGVTDHTLLSNIGTNTHAQIDTHIADSTLHYTQASIGITASQVSDFDTEVSNNSSVTANTAKVGVTDEISNVVEDTTPQLGGDLDANGNAIVAADHGTATSPQAVNVVYGTGTPPAASTTTEGTLFIEYV